MRVVERIQIMAQERRQRAERVPIPFALGVAPRPTNQPRQIHPCKKGIHSPPRMKPLITFAANIPYDCLPIIMMVGCTIKERHELLEIQKKTIQQIQPPDMQEDLWKQFRTREHWFFLESKCRVAFRRLVSHWLWKRYHLNQLNTEDPATLSEPIQPIRIFQSSARGTYIFEAKSLQKSMEHDLNYCDWLFPEPSHPKNPLTNLHFHLGHRIYILQQLRLYQQGSWMLESYQAMKWNLKVFRDIFLVPLKVQALEEICRNPTSEETINYMCEFIEDHYDYHSIYRPEILTVLKWAVKYTSTDSYMLEWLDAFKRFYSVQIIYGELYLENNLTIQRTLYGLTRALLQQMKQINRLAKIRNGVIQERRRQRVMEVESLTQPIEIDAIHPPIMVVSEVQIISLPLAHPILSTEPTQTTVLAQFELGDLDIDVLTERVSHLVDEWNHANS